MAMITRTAALSLSVVCLLALPGVAQAETVVGAGANRCAVVQALGGSCDAAAGRFGGASVGQTMGLVIEPTGPVAASAPAPQVREVAAPGPAAPVRRQEEPVVAAAFPSVTFAYDSAMLTAEARQMLDTIAAALREPSMQGRRFVVEGHTDASGSAAYNQALSEARARAVVQYLSAQGIPAVLEPTGRGESRLANAADPLAAENRRVVFLGTGA